MGPDTPRPVLGLVDVTGRFARVSSALAELVASDPGVLVGRPVGELFDPGSRVAFDEAWRRARAHAEPTSCAVVLDGAGPRPVEAWLEPLMEGDHGVVALLLRDLVAEHRVDREARLLRRVTQAANETSETGALFERALRDIAATMGWSPVSVVSAVDTSVGAPDIDEVVQRAWSSGRPTSVGGDAWRVAVPVVAGHDLAGRDVAGHDVAAVLVFSADHPVPLDTELTSLLTAVGRQLGSVVDRERVLAVLDLRTRELERSNSDLERFAYVASHDLQEPLRKIVGFSELLDQQLGDRLPDPGTEYLGYVIDGARRMQRLIKDLLAFSRAGRATPAFGQVDLEQLVAEVVDTLEFTLADAGAEVVVEPLPAVWGDPDQLAVVVTNLLSNAIKYHTGGARIVVSARHVPDAHEVELMVADDGIGIAPEYRGQIFEVFRRLHGASEYPGTGIGLSITERFVHAHGGRIWVTANQPRGSIFHVTLPVVPPKEPTP